MAPSREGPEEQGTAEDGAGRLEQEFRAAAVAFRVAAAEGDKAEIEAAKLWIGEAFARFVELEREQGVGPLLRPDT